MADAETRTLVLDWRKRQQTRAQGKVTIEERFDQGLTDQYHQTIDDQAMGGLWVYSDEPSVAGTCKSTSPSQLSKGPY